MDMDLATARHRLREAARALAEAADNLGEIPFDEYPDMPQACEHDLAALLPHIERLRRWVADLIERLTPGPRPRRIPDDPPE